MSEVRTRFAPSPTGFLHIGGMRTAFFSWLLARHFGGKFLLRIEDTDQERKVPGAIRYILEELAWFGVEIDEGPSPDELAKVGEAWPDAPKLSGGSGPYIQSLRLNRYKEVSEELIRTGAAYRCDCTPEMLERERNEQMARKELPGYSGYCRDRNVSPDTRHVVRFKMPFKRAISFIDGVRGRIAWESASLRDTVILKSDGFPTYHLAVVVDDHDMRITHALRGEEWISTTPLHLLIYEALGWAPPVIGHLPVVLGTDGKKLSKRHGATSSSIFREQGYLAQALLNFIVLIGWSPGEGDNQEVFTRDELIKKFSLEGISSASGVFDYNKLNWMNGVYIRNLSSDEFTAQVRPWIERAGLPFSAEGWSKIEPHVRERVKLLSEVAPMVEFLFVDKIERDIPAMYQKDIDTDRAIKILTLTGERLKGVDFEVAQLDGVLRGLAEELGLKPGPMFGVVRIAVTGKKITPPLFESLAALGKERTLTRIADTLKILTQS